MNEKKFYAIQHGDDDNSTDWGSADYFTAIKMAIEACRDYPEEAIYIVECETDDAGAWNVMKVSIFREADGESFERYGDHIDQEVLDMTDEELVHAINKCDYWDSDLMTELVWRAFPDCPSDCSDFVPAIFYAAAKELGFELN